MKNKNLAFVFVLLAAFSFSGCASKFVGILAETDKAIGNAVIAGAEKNCPKELRDARQIREKAKDTFWSCNSEEAMKLAQQATEKAKALCPKKPEAAPAVKQPEMAPAVKGGDVYPEKAPPVRFMLEGVNFATDSAKLNAVSIEILKNAAKILVENPKITVRIEGHTDSQASETYNQGLSLRRANAVKNYLVTQHKISADRLATEGFGESRPIASNDTAEGRAKNRRIEFVITGGN